MFAACLSSIVLLAEPAATDAAEWPDQPVQTGASEPALKEKDEIFSRGKFQAGISLAAGLGVAAFGSTEAHDLGLGSLHIGWMLTDVHGHNGSYRGNWEVVGELFGGSQLTAERRYLAGITPLLRYNFVNGSRWVPYITAGAGFCLTDIGSPDLSGTFQFDPQAGFGTHYFLRKHTSLTLEYRWLHISNAGLAHPNHGVNTQMLSAGMAWFF